MGLARPRAQILHAFYAAIFIPAGNTAKRSHWTGTSFRKSFHDCPHSALVVKGGNHIAFYRRWGYSRVVEMNTKGLHMSCFSILQLKTWAFYVPLALIMLSAVTARALLQVSPMGSDEMCWLATSAEIGGGERVDLPAAWHTRPLFRLVLYLWTSTFGDELVKTSILMYALVTSTLSLIAILGYCVAGPLAALIATTLYAFHPIALTSDSFCIPDGLGVPLVLGAVLSTICYWRFGRPKYFFASFFIAGLTFAVKEYFVLIVVPIFLLTWARALSAAQPIGIKVLLSAVAFAIGFGVQPALNYLDHHDYRQSYGTFVEYANLLIQQKVAGAQAATSSSVTSIWRRFDYISWLLFSNSMAASVTIAAAFVGVSGQRPAKTWEICLISLATAIFLAFLMFCPATFSPPVFVEMRPRYLTVVIPLWAVIISAMFAYDYNAMQRWKRALLVLVLVAYALSGMREADNRLSWSRHRVKLYVDGLRECLNIAKAQGIKTVAVTPYFQWRVPSEWMRGEPRVMILEQDTRELPLERWIDAVQRKNVGVYIARTHPKALQDKIVHQDAAGLETAYGPDRLLVEELLKRGWTMTRVFIARRMSRQYFAQWSAAHVDHVLVGYFLQAPTH